MKIRKLTVADLRSCAGLYAKTFNERPWRGKWTTQTALRHIRDCLDDPNFRGLVVDHESKLLGLTYGVVQHWENERRFYLKEMCIDRTQQRSGLGSKLFAELMRRLKRDRVRQINLGTRRDTPARKFYERVGFEVDSEIVIMSKRLSGTPGSKRRA